MNYWFNDYWKASCYDIFQVNYTIWAYFIYLDLSKSIPQKEWTPVYEESLKMADKLNLADLNIITINGQQVEYLTKVTEQEEEKTFWTDDGKRWICYGAYNYIKRCGANGLRRNLDFETDPSSGDPMRTELLSWMDEKKEDPDLLNKVSHCWSGKTQGEPQHILLLAIGCMIEERLPGKAYIHGDITRGQRRSAVTIANSVLDHPIQVPASCDIERLYKRIEFGKFLQKTYPAALLNRYWKDRFKDCLPGNTDFKEILYKYIEQRFSLRQLCHAVNMSNKEDKDLSEQFIQDLLNTKICLKKKMQMNITPG